ncbi:unnamed protein product [Mytilus edulis]|uniref:Uncharacterized protein n=1 Tax=Mytilus edulis TaxID=6550 RepID=A0A8S3VG71_MYTED|nr:unnamed protein product [Mytilus edulis]
MNDILEKQRTSVTWSELQYNCYVSLWVSWIGGTIEVGGGSEIGTYKLVHLPINHSIVVTDILIRSRHTAYWLFDFLEKASSVKTQGLNQKTISNDTTTTTAFHLSTVTTNTTRTIATSRKTPIVETTERLSSGTLCTCSCNKYIMTEDELITKIALLRSEQSIDPKLTNKYRR